MHADHSKIQIIAHVLVGISFITIGVINFFRRTDVHEEMRGFGVPSPEIVLAAGLTSQWLAGVLIMFDFYAGIGAIILMVFIVIASFIFLRWWKIKDNPFRRIHLVIGIFTNLSLLAVLLLILELNGLTR